MIEKTDSATRNSRLGAVAARVAIWFSLLALMFSALGVVLLAWAAYTLCIPNPGAARGWECLTLAVVAFSLGTWLKRVAVRAAASAGGLEN